MSSMPWIKLYNETLDDPKMGRLGDKLWRRAIELFMLAGREGAGGFLPDTPDIAWALRISEDDLIADLTELAKANIVKKTEYGWYVVHFAERQDADSNAVRQKRFRERKQHERYEPPEQPSQEHNEEVTQSNEERNEMLLREDKEEEKIKIKDSPPSGGGRVVLEYSNGSKPKHKPKPKPKAAFILSMERLENTFARARGCDPPDWEYPKEANKRWRTPLSTLLSKCKGDIDRAERLVEVTVEHMITEKLTFDAPDQILKTAGSLLADLSSGKLPSDIELTEMERTMQTLASMNPLRMEDINDTT